MGLLNSFSNWIRPTSLINRKIFFNPNKFGWSVNQLADEKAVEMYVNVLAAYSVIEVLASGVSSLPFKLGIKQRDGTIKEVTNGIYYDLVFKPNKHQSFKDLIELQIRYLGINGEVYQYDQREPGQTISEIKQHSLPPSLVTPEMITPGSILSEVKRYYFADGQSSKYIMPEDMMHVILPNVSPHGRATKNGFSPMQSAFNTINAAGNIEAALSWYFENKGSSIIISADTGGQRTGVYKLDTEERKSIEDALQGRIGGAHRMNKASISSVPITATTLNASAQDMQIIESYNNVVKRLAAAYKIPGQLLSIEDSTFNNEAEAKRKAYHESFIPNGQRIADGYNNQGIVSKIKNVTGEDYILYIDENDIKALKLTPLEKRKENREDVKAGIISVDEARMDIPGMKDLGGVYAEPAHQNKPVSNNK